MIHSRNIEFSELNNGFEIRSFSDGRIPSGFDFQAKREVADACREIILNPTAYGLDSMDIIIGNLRFNVGLHDDEIQLKDVTIGTIKYIVSYFKYIIAIITLHFYRQKL